MDNWLVLSEKKAILAVCSLPLYVLKILSNPYAASVATTNQVNIFLCLVWNLNVFIRDTLGKNNHIWYHTVLIIIHLIFYHKFDLLVILKKL